MGQEQGQQASGGSDAGVKATLLTDWSPGCHNSRSGLACEAPDPPFAHSGMNLVDNTVESSHLIFQVGKLRKELRLDPRNGQRTGH